MSDELIKNPGTDRFTVFPIVHANLWQFYKNHISTFWTTEEVVLSDDLDDWNNKLNDNERFFIKNVLAFFAASDQIINENIIVNFYDEVQLSEARQFYSIQIMMEAIHSEMYSLLIDTYISNTEEKSKLFNAIQTIPAVKKKAEWAIKWMSNSNSVINGIPEDVMNVIKDLQKLNIKDVEKLDFFTKKRPSFNTRLLAFIAIEGIQFSGSFCAIYYLKSKGVMPGLTLSNNFISRDENLHATFAIELYNMLDDKIEQEIVHEIFREAVDIEKEFITESLPVSLLGMNSKLMSQYIEYVADRWLVMLNYEKMYNSEQPFGFMELISVGGKTNFFESRNDNYQRPGIGQSDEDRKISFDDEDF